MESAVAQPQELEQHRRELTAHCYRMLGSPFEAEDAVQETLLRAWKALDRFEGRSSVRSWLYRIATNVCLDQLEGKDRRARPMDFGPAGEPVIENLHTPDVPWLQPVPDSLVADPAETVASRETIRLAFVAALQRARATLEQVELSPESSFDEPDRELLERYVSAFEAYDLDALTSLIHEDATQSMPPFDLWLAGREDIFTWWFGPGIGCKGSRVIPTTSANGSPAFAQYKPSESGDGYEPWALQVLELSGGRIVEFSFFLDTETLFPLFGLPPRVES